MRFGVEIEIDAIDGRDFASRPLSQGEMPAGSERVVEIVSSLGLEIQSHGWKHNHNNSIWICKPDSSCGIELCSPVLDEARIDEVLVVLDALAQDSLITCGPNCAFHVHVDVSSILTGPPESSLRLCSVLAWWVKCEAVFMDSVPSARKDSRFCRCIGMTELFDHDDPVVPHILVDKLKEKYLSLNTYHLAARKRQSIEFRMLEGTKDSCLASNWIRFVINFVRRTSELELPSDYKWISPSEVEFIVGSSELFSWLRGRVFANASRSKSRFWNARFMKEFNGFQTQPVFGQTGSFIGIGGDT